MNEKKKTSSSKKKSGNNNAATSKKKVTTKPATAGNKAQVRKAAPKPATAGNKAQVKKTVAKTDKKEIKKELPVVAAEIKKKDKTVNNKPIKNKPMEHSESAKVEKQLRERFRGNDEISKLFRIVLIVTGIMVVFYGVTMLVTKKADEVKTDDTTNAEQTEKAAIQYENIMIGTMLTRGGTYYTLIEEENDNRNAEYDSLIKTIKSSDDAPTIYKANLTDTFNKSYLGKEENYYAEDIAEFKVTGTTLLKVVDGKVSETFDSYDSIKNKLTELS